MTHVLEPRALSPFDLVVLGGLALLGVLYVIGSVRLARAGARVRGIERGAFAVGWLALVATALPPLDALAIELFSMHMAQHELMMLVGAPLIMAGRPLAGCLHALPPSIKSRATALLQARPLALGWRTLTIPVVAWVLHGAALWVWHLPRLYELAVNNEAVHAAQHAMFVGTSILFWWGMLYGRYGRAGYGAAVFFVFTTAVHTGILGAMVTFTGVPLYGVYLAPAARRGIDALGDQQVAGLLMWIPAGFVLTLFGIGLFAAWLGEAERRNSKFKIQNAKFKHQPTAGIVVLFCMVLGGCSRNQDRERVARELTGGDPLRGRTAIATYGCDTCHTIPGVLTAHANVGPPLTKLGLRTYLAGRLENTPDNLMQWVRAPRSVDPQTAMPDTGVTERDGRDIAAFLYTLR